MHIPFNIGNPVKPMIEEKRGRGYFLAYFSD